MVTVRSVSGVTVSAAGRAVCSSGSSALMLTVAITFAPGWRCTLTITAGVVSIQAPSLSFSAPSTTVATSARRTGWPCR